MSEKFDIWWRLETGVGTQEDRRKYLTEMVKVRITTSDNYTLQELTRRKAWLDKVCPEEHEDV